MIRVDNDRENILTELKEICISNGISIHPSPASIAESNGMAERLFQEHWTRDQLIMVETDLPSKLWNEALQHANWLRNRLPNSHMKSAIRLHKWTPNVCTKVQPFPQFGAPGLTFIYYPKNTNSKTWLPIFGSEHFFAVEGDQRMTRVYVPETKGILLLRRTDLHVEKNSPQPSVPSFLDVIFMQLVIDGEQEQENSNERIEEVYQSALASLNLNKTLSTSVPFYLTCRFVTEKGFLGVMNGPPLPT